MLVTVDIETIPDQSEGAIERIAESIKHPGNMKNQETIDAWHNGAGKYAGEKEKAVNQAWLKTSFDGAYGKIAFIGYQIEGMAPTVLSGVEGVILSKFWEAVSSDGRPPYFIAHHAKFDLPFLFKRSIINKVSMPVNFNPYGRNGVDHFCTMESWAGCRETISLDSLAKALGIPGKQGMSGADVWPEYQAGNQAKIAEYCKDDVRITWEIYKRITMMGGEYE